MNIHRCVGTGVKNKADRAEMGIKFRPAESVLTIRSKKLPESERQGQNLSW